MDFLIYKEKKSMNKDMKLLQMLKKRLQSSFKFLLDMIWAIWNEKKSKYSQGQGLLIAKDYYVVLAQENN